MRSMPSTNPSRVVEALASVSLIRTTLPLVRLTSVPTDERLAAPLIKSPSQWPGTSPSISPGRLWMLAMLQILPRFSSTLERRPRCGFFFPEQNRRTLFTSPPRRAVVDARHVADLAALFVDLGAPPPVRLVLPEASQQLLLQLPARQGVDRLVDRLMRHRQPG